MHARKAIRKKHDAAVTPMPEEQPFPRGGGGIASVPAASVRGLTDVVGRAAKRRRVTASVSHPDPSPFLAFRYFIREWVPSAIRLCMPSGPCESAA